MMTQEEINKLWDRLKTQDLEVDGDNDPFDTFEYEVDKRGGWLVASCWDMSTPVEGFIEYLTVHGCVVLEDPTGGDESNRWYAFWPGEYPAAAEELLRGKLSPLYDHACALIEHGFSREKMIAGLHTMISMLQAGQARTDS
jgi:hypothetical protein